MTTDEIAQMLKELGYDSDLVDSSIKVSNRNGNKQDWKNHQQLKKEILQNLQKE
jgi:hypothetical protein